MAISGVGQSYYQNNVATTKSTKSVNSTGETGNTKELCAQIRASSLAGGMPVW